MSIDLPQTLETSPPPAHAGESARHDQCCQRLVLPQPQDAYGTEETTHARSPCYPSRTKGFLPGCMMPTFSRIVPRCNL